MLFSSGICKFMGEDTVANQIRSTWNSNMITVMFSLMHKNIVEVKVVIERETHTCQKNNT